ncbi:MAG TPA: glycosyltransferase, partial [Pseudobdellovibrionaceae bacterium]|nr:glycosyltransferase [Pseudobdellovibrionaceae bacterium]
KLMFALRARRGIPVERFLKTVPHWVPQNLHLLPSSFDLKNGETMTASEIMKLIETFRRHGVSLKPLPYRDYKVGFREAQPKPELLWSSSLKASPKLSVIIPTRNSGDFLLNVIRHLFDQDLSTTDYEVIVVDDGSEETGLSEFQAFLGPMTARVQFKFIFCPRSSGRPEQFRAGFCRNVGLENSGGETILFLDSDMLVERDFLSGLLERIRTADVIQCPRTHIRPEKSTATTALDELKTEDLYIEEPGYWGPFFESSSWGEIPLCWRYTCTYCLAMPRAALEKVGPFREVFDSYGFEDTDLGYRLYRAGYRFHLWKKRTYHLTPPKRKSRYYHSMWMKQLLLAKTGKIFFLSNLDPEIYRVFKLYMGGESKWRQSFHGLFKF